MQGPISLTATMPPRLEAARKAIAVHKGVVLALALFLVAGLVALDDYGVTWDEEYQRRYVRDNLQYAAGDADALPAGADRFYGMGFELPLWAAERALGLYDDRSVHLVRHLLIHLFFLTGGLFAYLLACRLFGVRILALFAAALFLLHPRIYAHSFFNSKDIPFLVAFIIALFLAHRAFRRGSIPAFALLGAGVGALTHLRIMGVILFAGILAAPALDYIFASRWEERKRILIATSSFLLASALTFYGLLPYLWGNPATRILEWWAELSAHSIAAPQLFRGTLYGAEPSPPEYLPLWISITTPPFAALLGIIGAGVVLSGCAKAPVSAVRNTRTRFGLLAIGCFALPIGAVIFSESNPFDEWRHFRFLWAPFSALAMFGLHWLASSPRRPGLRTAAYGAAGAGIALTLIAMASIHPNQQVYFNFFVDRVTPEHLRSQFVMDYWRHPIRQGLEYLLESKSAPFVSAHSESVNRGRMIQENASILPGQERDRIALSADLDALILSHEPELSAAPGDDDLTLYSVKAYNNTILAIQGKQDLAAAYERVTDRAPDIHARLDLYVEGDAVVYVKEPCLESDPALSFRSHYILQFIPRDRNALTDQEKSAGFRQMRFVFPGYGAQFDGKCVASVPLPYPVAALRASQTWRQGQPLWEEEFHGPEIREARGRFVGAEPDARSVFDLHVADGLLAYVKEPCAPADTEAPFFLHILPFQATDLPKERRLDGFASDEFAFFLNGAAFDGVCVLPFRLPDYPVAAVRTGQRTEDGEQLWSASLWLNPEPHRAAYNAVASEEPLGRGAFDVHILGADVVYAKERCVQSDLDERFFLHVVPERVDDLPRARRAAGFDNLDFDFFRKGARFDGKCAARVPLPDYPVASIQTGQFVSELGETWAAEVVVARQAVE